MRTMAVSVTTLILLGTLMLLLVAPGRAAAPEALQESLAGLTPGHSTLQDAKKLLGTCDMIVPGEASYFAGGPLATRAYRWTFGPTYRSAGLWVETPLGSDTITLIMLDTFPGPGTSCGVTALMPESAIQDGYGVPDFAFEYQFADQRYRELFYLDNGLQFVLAQLPGMPNWTITKVILTYPVNLRNAVVTRIRFTLTGLPVENITSNYRVWAEMTTR